MLPNRTGACVIENNVLISDIIFGILEVTSNASPGCVCEVYLRQSTQGQIKPCVSTPHCLSAYLPPHKTSAVRWSVLQMSHAFESQSDRLSVQVLDFKCLCLGFNESVYECRVPAACSCVKCGSADEDDDIRDFEMEVIDMSLRGGNIDPLISVQPQSELLWVR